METWNIFFTILKVIAIMILALIPILVASVIHAEINSSAGGAWNEPKPGFFKKLVTWIVASLACIYMLSWGFTWFPNDDSKHCGPGTKYVSETHMSGKTTVTEWMCVTA
jgi:hypothetical protein